MSDRLPLDPDARLAGALGAQYEIQRLLGAGGMGRVWLARDRTLDRAVAIKVVAEDLAANPVYRERFLREARTVARLRHPGIVAVYAAGEADGLLYFVMEFVDGESLRDRMHREGTLPLDEAVAIVADVARALDAAHAQGVVHRDVKPENILLDGASGQPMLTDFGVAQGLEAGDGRMTATGMVVGSPRYMSPEQAVGERDLDGRSDLYALGLVAYELLSGAEPFEATSAGALLAKRLTTDPQPLAERAADVPAAVSQVVARALARERAARWPDGGSLAVALEAAHAGGDVDAAVATYQATRATASGARQRTSAATRATRAPQRARGARGPRGVKLALTVAAAALVLVAGALGVRRLTTGGVPDGPPRILVLPFEVQSGDAELAWLREGAVNMLTLDLAQWQDLAVVDYERTLDLLGARGLGDDPRITLKDAEALAREAGATRFVLGQLQHVGDSLRVVARVYDVGAAEPTQRIDEAMLAAADPRPLFDRVARRVLDLVGAPELTPSLAETTTPSLAAYRDYLQGVRALNRWQLDSADLHLRRAIQADSAFALAHHKLALVGGWRLEAGDSAGIPAARAAVRYAAARLRGTQRELVEAYLPLAEGIGGQLFGGTAEAAREQLRSARQRYADLVTRDSLNAEAWYGLGDAYFHEPAEMPAENAAKFSAALRAFDRTLALDSTFHLAYSHKLNIYQLAGTRGFPAILDGDSLATFTAADSVRARAARRRAQELAVREARHWVASDPDATQSHEALATAHATAGDYASAAAAIRSAMQRPSVDAVDFGYQIAYYELLADRPAEADAAFMEARRRVPDDSLRARGSPNAVGRLMLAVAVPLQSGRLDEMERVVSTTASLAGGIQSFGADGPSLADFFRAFAALGRAAAGVPWRDARGPVEAFLRRIPADTRSPQLQNLRQVVPAFAFYVSGDSSVLARLPEADRTRLAEQPSGLAARLALARGDTATAQRMAASFVRGDTTLARRTASLELASQAQVLVELGDLRGAVQTYEGMSPQSLTVYNSIIDPGWAIYPRSFAARAELYAQLGERERAVRAYEEFIGRWANADAELQPQVRAARARLAEIRDGAPTAVVRTR